MYQRMLDNGRAVSHHGMRMRIASNLQRVWLPQMRDKERKEVRLQDENLASFWIALMMVVGMVILLG